MLVWNTPSKRHVGFILCFSTMLQDSWIVKHSMAITRSTCSHVLCSSNRLNATKMREAGNAKYGLQARVFEAALCTIRMLISETRFHQCVSDVEKKRLHMRSSRICLENNKRYTGGTEVFCCKHIVNTSNTLIRLWKEREQLVLAKITKHGDNLWQTWLCTKNGPFNNGLGSEWCHSHGVFFQWSSEQMLSLNYEISAWEMTVSRCGTQTSTEHPRYAFV